MSTSDQSHITESSILTSYLLTPSPLPTALPYSTFLSTCVPAAHRSHPHIKHLYRDLQFQRNIDVDSVRENIERECAKSGVLKGRLARQIQKENGQTQQGRKRKRTSSEHRNVKTKSEDNEVIDSDKEDEFGSIEDQKAELTLHNASAHPASRNDLITYKSSDVRHHTPTSLLSSMEAAVLSLEQEIAEMKSQKTQLLEEMTETVGQLSDLRYGRFPRSSGAASDEETVEDGIVEALAGLRNVMERAR